MFEGLKVSGRQDGKRILYVNDPIKALMWFKIRNQINFGGIRDLDSNDHTHLTLEPPIL